MTTQPPAGWYPQTDGTQRYWDGSQWTEHTAPGAGAAAVAPAMPVTLAKPGPAQAALPAVPTIDARPWWKKKRFIIPGVGVALFMGLIVLGGIAAAIGAGATEKPAPLAASSSSATASPSPSLSEAPSESAAPTVFTMPDVVGDNLQDAQDELQSLGSLLMDQQDASGKGRMQVIDSNWTVCSQEPAAGADAPITTVVILAVVKNDEACPGAAAAAPAAPAAPDVPAAPAAPDVPALTVAQEQAVEKAKDYLDFTSFSRLGLIGQLEFEGFSNADATLAVDSVNSDWNAQAALKAQSYLDFTSFSHSGLVDQLTFEGFTPEQAEFGVTSVGL